MGKGLTLNQAILRYGAIIKGVWANEAKWCRRLEIPIDISQNWINSATQRPTTAIYCNTDLVVPLARALDNLRKNSLLSELKTFDGCFHIRDTRGVPGQPSMHSWAAAIDINAFENQLGGPSNLSPEFVQCFIDANFIWGGHFRRPDPMHFSVGF